MTKRLLDYDPLSGMSVTFDYGADDRLVITHSQDVSRFVDDSKALANDTDRTRRGIKNDLWHYARVPAVVIMEMKEKHGVDFYRKEDRKRVFELLNTEYQFCKTTNLTHTVSNG
jgi:hypothetical protein